MLQNISEISIILFAGTSFVLLIVISLFVFIYIHSLRVKSFAIEMEAREIQKQKSVLLALSDGEERERKRLAEELHDGMGAKLSAIKMGLESIEEYLITDTETSKERLQKNILYLNESINELRDISKNLHPAFLEQAGLQGGISSLIYQFNSKNNIHIDQFIDITFSSKLNPSFVLHIYRIVAELLNNIIKHSKANKASVQIVHSKKNIVITVEDNGTGIVKRAVNLSGIGLTSIRERVAALEGSINVDSSDKGTIVIIHLPFNED